MRNTESINLQTATTFNKTYVETSLDKFLSTVDKTRIEHFSNMGGGRDSGSNNVQSKLN